tara:strand:+ start:168 stop:392 length:225 start_codon:yes stop_codon:yes gene_type:complete
MARNRSGFVAVFVKYPATSHRAQLAPGFTPWGNVAISTSDPDCDRKVAQASNTARARGCEVRIKQVDPTNGGQK